MAALPQRGTNSLSCALGESETEPIQRQSLASQFATSGTDGLTSNFSADGYRAAVGRVIDYIYAGDVFQVNLAQRLLHPAVDDSVSLYLRLRRRNAATFAGFFDLGDFQIVSASPERFLTVRDRCVETRPIKGTCQRTLHPEADLFAGEALRQSEKRMEVLRFANDVALKLMHELRNPLTSVGGFSALISNRDYPEDKLKEYARMIFEESSRLNDAVDKVLAHLKTSAEQV